MNADILKQIPRHEALILIKAVGLRKKYEQVMIMKYVEDLSYIEIGDRINLTEKSVSNLMVKARRQFDKFTGS